MLAWDRVLVEIANCSEETYHWALLDQTGQSLPLPVGYNLEEEHKHENRVKIRRLAGTMHTTTLALQQEGVEKLNILELGPSS